MKIMKLPFDLLDKFLIGTLIKRPNRDELAKIGTASEYQDSRKKHRDFIFQIMNSLDTKSAALLTHLSLIITCLTFMYSSPNVLVINKYLILIEIILYLSVTILCLRIIKITSGQSDKFIDDNMELEFELHFRREIFRLASALTIIVTTILIFSFCFGAIISLITGSE
jgi:hypothetical protein